MSEEALGKDNSFDLHLWTSDTDKLLEKKLDAGVWGLERSWVGDIDLKSS